MASGIYDRLKYNLMKKVVDLSADTIKVILLTSSHSFNATHNVLTDVNSNEITGTGYTANGTTLTSLAVTQDGTNHWAKWTADNAVWSSATFSAAFAVIYDSTATSNLIACIDFGGTKSVSGGTFTIQWAGGGIIQLA